MSKSRKIIYISIIGIVSAIACVLVDLFILHCATLPYINTLVATCFTSFITIVGFWVAYYLLFLELFHDSYQMHVLKKNLYKSMKETFILVICCLLFGAIIMIFPIGAISSIFFSLSSITIITKILINIFNSHKTLMISSHIDKLQQEIEMKIKKCEPITFSELKDFRYLYDECIVKEEYYTIQNIVEKSGELFRTFLINSIGKLNSDDLTKSFDAILNFNSMQLDFCKAIKSELLISKIAKQQYDNLKFCIDNFQTEWYKRYLEQIKFFLTTKKDTTHQKQVSVDLFHHMYKIVILLIEREKEDLAEYTTTFIQEHISAYKFEYKNIEIDNFAMYNYLILSECEDKGYDTWFVKISNYLIDFANNIYIKDIPFQKVKSYYALIFNYYCNKDKYKALNFCSNAVNAFKYDINSTEFTSFKFYCITELYKLCENDTEFAEKVYIAHLKILERSMSIKNRPDIILLPELENIILKGPPIKEKYTQCLNEFKSLLETCIIENQVPHFYKFLTCINDALIKTKLQQKDIQIALLDIYIWSINRSKNIANRNFYKISFELLEDSIFKLDKESLISDNLGKHIINMLSDFAKGLGHDNHEIINSSIELLRSFSSDDKTLFFILKSPERKQQLYQSLFNIGTNCIENNYEEGARRISNTLGWSIISYLKQSPETVNHLIDCAIDLYDISTKMATSITTQVFIATLFTTIGAYCSKESKLYPFRNRIIERLNAPVETLEIAAKLRTSESDIWNHLFENKIEYFTNEFLKLYKERHS